MSYSSFDGAAETVREDGLREIRCARCRGTGLVEVQGQDSDCIDCDGYGTVLI